MCCGVVIGWLPGEESLIYTYRYSGNSVCACVRARHWNVHVHHKCVCSWPAYCLMMCEPIDPSLIQLPLHTHAPMYDIVQLFQSCIFSSITTTSIGISIDSSDYLFSVIFWVLSSLINCPSPLSLHAQMKLKNGQRSIR